VLNTLNSKYNFSSLDTNLKYLIEGDELVVPFPPNSFSLNCNDWTQEAILRLAVNSSWLKFQVNYDNLDLSYRLPSNEQNEQINWENLRELLKNLLELKNDETLLVQSGQVIDTVKSDKSSPRAFFINTSKEKFENIKEKSLQLYENSLYNNISYSGYQELLYEIYKFYFKISQDYFQGSLKNKLIVSSGLGRVGAIQALAIKMNGGVAIVSEINKSKVKRVVEGGFCQVMYEDLEVAFDVAFEAKRYGHAKSIALFANSADVIPKLVDKGFVPNVVTDLSNSSNSLNGFIPSGYYYDDVVRIRRYDPQHYKNLSNHSAMLEVKSMLELQKRGSIVFESGNNIREKAYNKGLENAFSMPSFIEKYMYPILYSDKLKFKFISLTSNEEDILFIDDIIINELSDNKNLTEWINKLESDLDFQGLSSRICKMTYEEGVKVAKKINEKIKNEEITSPIALVVSNFEHITNDKIDRKSIDILNSVTGLPKNVDWVSLNRVENNENECFINSEIGILINGKDETIEKIEQISKDTMEKIKNIRFIMENKQSN